VARSGSWHGNKKQCHKQSQMEQGTVAASVSHCGIRDRRKAVREGNRKCPKPEKNPLTVVATAEEKNAPNR
jgi:hypothetical protein